LSCYIKEVDNPGRRIANKPAKADHIRPFVLNGFYATDAYAID